LPRFFLRRNGGRIFSGVWAYLTIAVWGGSSDEDFGVDVVVYPFSQAVSGKVVLTASLYCDCAVRWPALFSCTAANAVP
jgi:hypothetical protein